ncbi:MAG: hypothetical protein GY906_25155 [bacterium]|nr:hypothetical protein [bacterium]
MKLKHPIDLSYLILLVLSIGMVSCSIRVQVQESWEPVKLLAGTDGGFQVLKRYTHESGSTEWVPDYSKFRVLFPDGSTASYWPSELDSPVWFWVVGGHLFSEFNAIDLKDEQHHKLVLRIDKGGDVESCADISEYFYSAGFLEFHRVGNEGTSVVYIKHEGDSPLEILVDLSRCSPVDLFSEERRSKVAEWQLESAYR